MKKEIQISAKKLAKLRCLFFIVVTCIAIYNAGYIGRALSFPLMFLFGSAAYVIYIVILGLSIYNLILKEPKRSKSLCSCLAIAFILIGCSIIFTRISYKKFSDVLLETQNYRFVVDLFFKKEIQSYPNIYSLGGLFKIDQIRLFSSMPLGGGLLGNVLYTLLSGVSKNFPLAIGIVLITFGIVAYAFKFIPKLKKQMQEEKEREAATDAPAFVKNKTYIKDAAFIDSTYGNKLKDENNGSESLASNLVSSFEPETATFKSNPKSNHNSNLRTAVFGDADFEVANAQNVETKSSFIKTEIISQPKVEAPKISTFDEDNIIENFLDDDFKTKSLESESNNKPFGMDLPKFNANLNIEEASRTVEKVVNPVFEEKRTTLNNYIKPEPTFNDEIVDKKPFVWIAPSASLLKDVEKKEANQVNIDAAENQKQLINSVFEDFNVGASVNQYIIGPSVTRYYIEYLPNVSFKSVDGIVKDIAIRLGGVLARFAPIIEGVRASGLEIPNPVSTMVSFKEVFEGLPSVDENPYIIPFGKGIDGKVLAADFRKFPHMLVAGTSGSGKSVYIHTILTTLIMRNSPEKLKLAIIDPKRIEMNRYKDIPHLLCPVISDAVQAKNLLRKLVDEMNHRYDLLEQATGCNSLDSYNRYAEKNGLEKLPYIFVVVDEYGDLVETCKEVSQPVQLIGQKARSCGIHLLVATQRPSSNIITGTIRSNLDTKVALKTSTSTDSVIVLGEGGAEKLLKRGDMLVGCGLITNQGFARCQSAYIDDIEIENVTNYLRDTYGPQYDERFIDLEDPRETASTSSGGFGLSLEFIDEEEKAKYEEVRAWVQTHQYMSMSRIQSECRVGSVRARRFFARLQQEGVVSTQSEANKGCLVIDHDGYDFDEDEGLDSY